MIEVFLEGWPTIKNDDDLKSWLTKAEECIRNKMKDGPVIL